MRKVLGRVLCALSMALALVPASASAAEVPNHLLIGTITGAKIGPFEQIKGACGVAVDSAENVYVADYYQNRVAVFDKDWNLRAKVASINPIDAEGIGPVDGPCDLAVDSAGNLYVNDYHRDVLRFAPAGGGYGQPSTIDAGHPTGVAVDPTTDRVYVDERTRVAVYEPSGEPAMEGSEELAIGEGSLGDAYGVAVSSFPGTAGLVYVADAATETIKVYDPSVSLDEPVQEISGEGTQQGGFHLTDSDLAIDPNDGHLYVSDDLEPFFEEKPELVVDEFNAKGLYRGSVPDSFAALGQPSFLEAGEPSGLAITGAGRIYVSSGNYEDAEVFAFGPPAPAVTKLLTVSKSGAGEGRVTSIPAGIGCGGVCEGEFNEGVNVVLKANPAPGSVFVDWTGCDEEPTPGRCAVSMNAARAVAVEFGPAPASGIAAVTSGAPSSPGTAAGAAATTSPLAATGRESAKRAKQRARKQRAKQRRAKAKRKVHR
jgi:DNA-binding beta-propeller fold protein YncE